MPFARWRWRLCSPRPWGPIVGAGAATMSAAEIKQRIEALRSAGYTQFTIQLVPGHEHALADWARIRKAFA
jgi:hypothetical protein